jgi:hypothetical protein
MNFSITSYEYDTWNSFVNDENNERSSSGCTHIHQTIRKSGNKQSDARKQIATVMGQKNNADGGIHAKWAKITSEE